MRGSGFWIQGGSLSHAPRKISGICSYTGYQDETRERAHLICHWFFAAVTADGVGVQEEGKPILVGRRRKLRKGSAGQKPNVDLQCSAYRVGLKTTVASSQIPSEQCNLGSKRPCSVPHSCFSCLREAGRGLGWPQRSRRLSRNSQAGGIVPVRSLSNFPLFLHVYLSSTASRRSRICCVSTTAISQQYRD